MATGRRRRWALAGFAAPALVALAAGSLPARALDVPYLSGRVVDEAGMVPPATRERIEQKLAAFEQETGAQVAVLTVPSLQGDSLEGFSVKVAETWKLGRKGKDDGVLLLIARDDRKMRIEVGYGLEGTLTDLKSARILSDVIRPRFRAGDFGGGIEAAVDAILGTLRGNPEAIPKAPVEAVGGKPGDWAGRLFGLAVFAVVVGIHSAVALGSSGGTAWFLYFFLMIFWAVFPAVLISPVAGFVLLAAVGRRLSHLAPLAGEERRRQAAGQAPPLAAQLQRHRRDLVRRRPRRARRRHPLRRRGGSRRWWLLGRRRQLRRRRRLRRLVR